MLVLGSAGWRKRGELRAEPRFKCAFRGRISGEFGKAGIRGVDLHESGAGIRTRRMLEPGTLVFVHFRTFKLMGFATVRYCKRSGLLNHHIGLKFRGPLMREEAGSTGMSSARMAPAWLMNKRAAHRPKNLTDIEALERGADAR